MTRDNQAEMSAALPEYLVFPANIYVYQHQEIIPASHSVHFLRLVLQGVLILWAYWHTRSDAGTAVG